MTRKTIIIVLLAVVIIIALVAVAGILKFNFTDNDITIKNSGVAGSVLLGPTCPVMRVPPDPQCNDKPYQGNFVVTTTDGLKTITKFSSDALGKFKVNLAPGEYIIKPAGTEKMLPRCSESAVFKVVGGEFTEVNISCDTGIR